MVASLFPNPGAFSQNPTTYSVGEAKADQDAMLGAARQLLGAIEETTVIINGGILEPGV